RPRGWPPAPASVAAEGESAGNRRWRRWPRRRAPASSRRRSRRRLATGPSRKRSPPWNSILRICGTEVGTAQGFYPRIPISAQKPSAERLEAAFEDGRTHVGQEPQIEGQIVQRQEAVDQELARREQVAQIGPGEEPAGLATAFGVERCSVAGEPRIADGDGPIMGERLAIARIARRHDAVEHVHAAC